MEGGRAPLPCNDIMNDRQVLVSSTVCPISEGSTEAGVSLLNRNPTDDVRTDILVKSLASVDGQTIR